MKRFILGIGALVASTSAAMPQETIIVERKTVVVYERVIITETPNQLAQLSVAARDTASLRCDKLQSDLPSPYFCFVRATANNLPASMHHLLQPVSGNGQLLCGAVKNAYSLVARKWQGQTDLQAAVNIAKKIGGTPCGFTNGLTLSNFHISLRTATDPKKHEPSWVVAWQDQYQDWHFYAYQATRDVLALR